MLKLKNKFTKLAMGLIVTSVISVGAISPVSAMESQPNLESNAGIKTQCEVMKDSYSNEHAAAQFTYNEDGEKVLTVTPKSDFRSHNKNAQNGACEDPVIGVETPLIDEAAPVVETPILTPVVNEETPVAETPVLDEETAVTDEETPVIDEETPMVETPVVDEETPDESVQNGFYAHLLNTYDKLLTLYDKLINSFELGTTN